MTFSEQLIYIRAKRKLSQEQMAKELGVSLVTINRWENEVIKPSKVSKMRLVEYCKDNAILCEVPND